MVAEPTHGAKVDAQAALRRGIGLLESDPAGAEAVAHQLLDAVPGDPLALTLLGSALRARGEPAAALAVLEPLAQSQATSWIILFELARALFALGRSREATNPLSRAVAFNPGAGAAWRLLGDILLVSGEVAAAQNAYDRLLASVVPDPRLQAPALALADGRLAEAERDLRAVLTQDPNSLAAAHLMGELLARQGRLADAERLMAACVEQAPGLNLARQAYALTLLGVGKPAQALAQLDLLLSRDPTNNRARMARAAALTEVGDYASAADATAAVLKDFPDQPQGWLVYGNGLRTLGRIAEAVAAYDRCLELDPACSAAYWSLANLKAYRFAPEALAAMQAQLTAPESGPEDRANLHFALGKAREDAGDYADAFRHYAEGNALERQRRAYDPAATTALVMASKTLFTPTFFAQRAGWGLPAPDPIFIVGLPRSGSTLVDQILASHPEVEGTRELMDIQTIADWVAAAAGGYPGQIGALPRDVCEKLGRDYLEWTRPLRRRGAARFTDKAPWNFLHTGLIHLILPGAKIIDVRRHPLGCGLSAFKQHFSQGFDFSYDLADIGHYYADYVELMAHFDAVLPGRVHRVIYERLVDDTEAEVRRLLDYLDLPFDPACLRFFENPRAVATPSSEQVRRPIYAEGVGQWKHFEPWLEPLKTALGPVLTAYPEAP